MLPGLQDTFLNNKVYKLIKKNYLLKIRQNMCPSIVSNLPIYKIWKKLVRHFFLKKILFNYMKIGKKILAKHRQSMTNNGKIVTISIVLLKQYFTKVIGQLKKSRLVDHLKSIKIISNDYYGYNKSFIFSFYMLWFF